MYFAIVPNQLYGNYTDFSPQRGKFSKSAIFGRSPYYLDEERKLEGEVSKL